MHSLALSMSGLLRLPQQPPPISSQAQRLIDLGAAGSLASSPQCAGGVQGTALPRLRTLAGHGGQASEAAEGSVASVSSLPGTTFWLALLSGIVAAVP